MNNYDTTKYTSLKYYNANTMKAFRGLLKSLKSNGLEILKVTNHEEDIDVSKDTPVLEIMDHCFSCESYAIYVKDPTRPLKRAKLFGLLDGCVDSMVYDWGMGKEWDEGFDEKIMKAVMDFTDKYEDLDLSAVADHFLNN